MNRYNKTQITRNTVDGKQTDKVYRQTITPSFNRNEKDTYFYSRDSDRLDLLANEFYGDTTLWWVIASANNLGKGTFSIPPGKLIRIPYNRNFNL